MSFWRSHTDGWVCFHSLGMPATLTIMEKKMNVELTDSQIYTLYETVVNNIEDLSYKYKDTFTGEIKRACKSDKYRYKWKELHILKDLLNGLIDWDKPCSNTTDMCVQQ